LPPWRYVVAQRSQSPTPLTWTRAADKYHHERIRPAGDEHVDDLGKEEQVTTYFGRFLATAGTVVVSVGAYSLLFGWPSAAGIVALLFVHEMDHVLVLRREGVKASPRMFVPFLGAVIAARSLEVTC
jgi:hypothetical protein